ncbi:MAG: surface layer protein [Oscillibacter sp.]|nr:surface layer protein [Oscillibacter sp.]
MMNRKMMKCAAALALAAVLTTGNASALFGSKKEEAPEGAPAVQELEVTTYRDIPAEGQLQASDAEGGELTYAIADEPKKGSVAIEGETFTYTPKEGMTGKDSFTYTATDPEGNTSLPGKVTIVVEKTRSGVEYADMDGDPAARAAQHLAEAGIYTGGKIGSHYYFQPDQPVTRSEFLAMALETAGREVTAVTMTGFADDESIPTWAKAYAAAGVADGVMQGRHTPNGAAFYGSDVISFNEAATVLDRVLNLGDVNLDVWYADQETVPSWAAQAVANMEAVNVLAAGSFGSQTMEQAVTRADAAQMLSAVKTLMDGGESSGWFH